MVYSTDRVVSMLLLLFVALWFSRRGDLFCLALLFCSCGFFFSVLLALRLPRLGKRELILVLFVRLFDLRLFDFVCFLFVLVSGKGCDLWLWHSLVFSPTFLAHLSRRLRMSYYDQSVRHPSVCASVYPSVLTSEQLLLWNPLAKFLQPSYRA